MKLVRRVYVLFMLCLSLGVYTLLLGDVGYLHRMRLQGELQQLQERITLLETQNQYLDKQYHLLQAEKRKGQELQGNADPRELLILKFDQRYKETLDFSEFLSRRKDTLGEMRLLFIIVMLFLSAGGYMFLRYLSRESFA